jgi:ferredoxin
MDVCPVQALDMTRPQRPGVEGAGVFGTPFKWMMEYPVQVGECIGCGICVRECPTHVVLLDTVPVRRRSPRARARSIAARRARSGLAAAQRRHDANRSSRPASRRGAPPSSGVSANGPRTGRSGGRWSPTPAAIRSPRARKPAPPERTPGGMSGLIGQGRYDEAYAVAAEVNPFPSVCGWICTAPCESVCRRGTLDEPIAIRRLKRFAAEQGKLPAVPAPKSEAPAEGRDRRRRTGRNGRRVLPDPTRLRGDRLRGDACAGRHDGHRHPRIPAASRGPARRDRPDRRSGRGAEARQRDGPRLHAGRSGGQVRRRLPGDGRLSQPQARRPRRRPAGSSSRPRSSSSRSTSARSPPSGARSW